MFRVMKNQPEKADTMKKSLLISGIAATFLGLTACIHVDEGDHSDLDEIAVNTETALRVCGGPGTIAKVDEDGFSCKDND